MIQFFFILPTEAIAFLNSCLFTGLIIADGTFLKFFKFGELIIFAGYFGTHQTIPLGMGICKVRKSWKFKFFEILKTNISDELLIKAFMTDEGTGLMKTEKEVFPMLTKRNCILHKKKHLSKIDRELMNQIVYHTFSNLISLVFPKKIKTPNEI